MGYFGSASELNHAINKGGHRGSRSPYSVVGAMSSLGAELLLPHELCPAHEPSSQPPL